MLPKKVLCPSPFLSCFDPIDGKTTPWLKPWSRKIDNVRPVAVFAIMHKMIPVKAKNNSLIIPK